MVTKFLIRIATVAWLQPSRQLVIEEAANWILTQLASHFSPKPLLIAELFPVMVFVAAIRRLAEHCEFNNVLINKQKKSLQNPRHGFKNRSAVHSMQHGLPTTEASNSPDEAATCVSTARGGTKIQWISPLLDGQQGQMEINTGLYLTLFLKSLSSTFPYNPPVSFGKSVSLMLLSR